MQIRSCPRWLRIVSTRIAVLPVVRSPMISSRWPRPIGIIESIALRPVCIGSLTGWRSTTPGALISAKRLSLVSMSPLPSSGLPSGSTMRPRSASPTGTSRSSPVRLTVSPSTILSQSPNITVPTLSDSRFSARPVTPWGNSSISNDCAFSSPWTRAMPSATESTVPTSVSSAWPSSRPSMRLFRMLVISSGLICISQSSGGLGHVLSQVVEAVADGGIKDGVPDTQHKATDDVGVDGLGELDALAGLLADLIADAPRDLVVELHGARDLDAQELVLALPQFVVGVPYAEDRRRAVLLHEQLEEVQDGWVGAVDHLRQPVLLLLGGEVGAEEEDLQLAVVVERVGDLAELLADLVELVLFLGHFEERPCVDAGDLFHLASWSSRRSA